MNDLTTATNAAPYVVAAYLIGVVCIFGFSFWLYASRVKVERYLATFSQGGAK